MKGWGGNNFLLSFRKYLDWLEGRVLIQSGIQEKIMWEKSKWKKITGNNNYWMEERYKRSLQLYKLFWRTFLTLVNNLMYTNLEVKKTYVADEIKQGIVAPQNNANALTNLLPHQWFLLWLWAAGGFSIKHLFEFSKDYTYEEWINKWWQLLEPFKKSLEWQIEWEWWIPNWNDVLTKPGKKK